MPEPTQAQIEAAAKAIRDVEEPEMPIFEFIKHAEAALTAAAEAGERDAQIRDCDDGDMDIPLDHSTIERCTQVEMDHLIKFQNSHDPGQPLQCSTVSGIIAELVAAISAMKEDK